MDRRATQANYNSQNANSSRSHAFLTLLLTRHTMKGLVIQATRTTKMCAHIAIVTPAVHPLRYQPIVLPRRA
eukprot:3413690-Prymnesium_polylepis.1